MRVWAMAQTVCVLLDDATKLALSTIAGDRSRPLKHLLRARIVLLSFERLSVQDVLRQAGVSRPAVWCWQQRFAERGVEGLLRDKTHPPRTPPRSTHTVAKMLALTCSEPPDEVTHWTGDCQEFRVEAAIVDPKEVPDGTTQSTLHPSRILDQLLAGADPKTAFESDDSLDALKKALAERALNAEMDHHLAGEEAGNTRNGYGRKTVTTETGRIELAIHRDRQATFDPQLLARYQRRFPGFDDKIVSMYARGMSTREIVGHLRELYGIEVSPDLISAVTNAVLEEVAAWQARPLEPVYPIVFFDALRIKVRDEGSVRNKAVHIALGVRADGSKEILGLWLEQNEGAKFWLRVMNELRNRGVEDVLLAVVDGLKGFPDAIRAVFPEALVQTCIVHFLRHSLDFVSYKDRKLVAAALKEIYRALDATAGEAALAAFEAGEWGRKYPAIAQSWRRAWGEVIPFYAFPVEVRRILYTKNAIEALNATLRRAVRSRGHFPTDEAALKLLYLVLNRSEKAWKMGPRDWVMAKAQFAVIFGERFTRAMAA